MKEKQELVISSAGLWTTVGFKEVIQRAAGYDTPANLVQLNQCIHVLMQELQLRSIIHFHLYRSWAGDLHQDSPAICFSRNQTKSATPCTTSSIRMFSADKILHKIHLHCPLLTAIISNVSNFEISKTLWPQKSLITVSVCNKEKHGKPRRNCGIPTSKWITSLNIGVTIVYATPKCQEKKKINEFTVNLNDDNSTSG